MSIDIARRVLEIESRSIADLIERLDERFDEAVRQVSECQGRVVVTGMGKSGIIGQKIAATLNSTGRPSVFMHPAEAIHGDLGMLVSGDVLLAISNSGETEEIVRLLELVRRIGAGVIALTGQPGSTLALEADVHIDVGVKHEACNLDLVPTSSTTAALAMGDAIAVACYELRGFSPQDFARFHPGGRLGRRLLRVRGLMHSAESLPSVRRDRELLEAIAELDSKKLGMVCVTDDEGLLVGIITDGDLRRRLLQQSDPLKGRADEAMASDPCTIGADSLASVALKLMEQKKITSLPVVDDKQLLLGVIQIHDLWRTELF